MAATSGPALLGALPVLTGWLPAGQVFGMGFGVFVVERPF
jgi:hypothetical protein